MNPSTHPENFDLCRYCGDPYCDRLIEKSDGSIRSNHDTGYRFIPAKHIVKPFATKFTAPLRDKHLMLAKRNTLS